MGEPTAGRSGTADTVGHRPLGSQGLVVSDQGLGCMGLHTAEGPDGHAEAVATVDRALELGITFFDTADVYGPTSTRSWWPRHSAPTRSPRAGLVGPVTWRRR